MKHRLWLAALTLICGAARAQALDLPAVPVPVTIAGVALHIPVSGTLDLATQGQSLQVKIAAKGDLGEMQSQALAIARALPLPHEACGKKKNGASLVVNSIDKAELVAKGETVVVEMQGRATVWACAKVLGAMVKTEVARDAVKITVPVELYLPTPHEIAARLSGNATIETGDPQLKEAAEAVLGDLDARFGEAVAKALDGSKARAALPPINGLDIAFSEAKFVTEGTKLEVVASGAGTVSAEALAQLIARAAGAEK